MEREPAKAKPIWDEVRLAVARGRQVWRLISSRDKWALRGAGMVMLVVSAAAALNRYLIGALVNVVPALQENSDSWRFFSTVGLYLGGIAGLFILAETLQVVRKLAVENTSTRIERDRVAGLVTHLLKVELSVLARERVGALHGRISRAVEGFVKFIKLTFQDMFPAFLGAVFALLAVYLSNWKVGLLMTGVLPTTIFIVVRQLISQGGIRLELLRSREALEATVVEQLGGIEYVRAANTHALEGRRIEHMAELRRQKEIKHHTAMALFDCAKSLAEGLFLILVIALSIYLARQGEMEYGSIVGVSLQFTAVAGALREIHRFLDDAHESSLRVGDLLDLMKLPLDRSFGQVTLREPQLDHSVPIVLADGLRVEYTTPEGKSRLALDGVCMSLRHGETIGAAGPSGSGKSTWLRVLMRLTHPKAGRVLVGGVPLETLSRDSIGKLIGYVGQNPFLFAGTVAENIAYGVDGAKPAMIQQAAERACIHDEIMALPGGYQAELTERGLNLSGGQRQRIALARVFLKNPPLMILDEGTSALDNISERRVQQAITAARADRTVIMVAHRLSTLRDADRIFVFQDGKIAEVGSYDDLVQQGGVFAKLVRSAEAHTASA
jgi:ATP-binding cassette subfamily B protein